MEISISFKTNNKARGEWVELCFMTKAAGMGLRVFKHSAIRPVATSAWSPATGSCVSR